MMHPSRSKLATMAALLSLPASSVLAQSATSRVVSSANAFLSTLSASQQQSVQYAFDDETQRVRWSNLPIGMVPRGGIALKDLTPPQRTAAMTLLASALSPRGFEKVQQIMEGDEANKNQEANRGGGGPPGGFKGKGKGGGPQFGKDNYYLSILGTPSATNPWMIQFGGHHLAVNLTISGAKGILTPTLTGAQPALFTLEGKTVRPLGQESDKAAALLNALDENQRKQAVLSFRVADLVLGPGQDGKTIQPEGLKAPSMNEKQRAMLLDLIGEWANIVHESAAAARMAELKAELNDTWFAWSGPTNVTPGTNIASYYRIQGPHVVIEFAPQGLGGDPSNHIHTMYRDPTNDYGRKPASK
jgi:Protein of unknown function (DUF3500)